MNFQKKGTYCKEGAYTHRGGRKGFDRNGGVLCKKCFAKDQEIYDLKQELCRLKSKLKAREKSAKTEGVFGKSTPSSQVAIKQNSLEENQKKKGGARAGHAGHGRRACNGAQAENIVLDMPTECPDCHVKLHAQGEQERTVVDVAPIKAKRILYKCSRGRCPQCFRAFTKKPPAFPKALYGNELLAQAIAMHYVHGVSLGRILEIFGPEVREGGLLQAFHRIGKVCEKAIPELIREYRNSPVRHADETGWRTDGKGGYAWIFCSDTVSIFRFGESRSARVAHQILGTDPLAGVLVVDRYPGYNKVNSKIQYCYGHLLRDVEGLRNEFPDNKEVCDFTSSLADLLAQSMRLRNEKISDKEFYRRAKKIKKKIEKIAKIPAKHMGIIEIQSIFTTKEHRLYHWAEDRRVPAENNAAEREIRPSVVARKMSYGSQSEQGAKTRSAIMSVLYTARKKLRGRPPPEVWLKEALDKLAENPNANIFDLLPKVVEESTPSN